MTRDRLGPSPPKDRPPLDAEASPLELAEARDLQDALRAAWSPTALDAARNDALIAAALSASVAPHRDDDIARDEPLAPAEADELAAARALGDALDARAGRAASGAAGATTDSGLVELAEALRAAVAPDPLDSLALARAVAAAREASRKPRGRVVFLGVSAAGALALAAAAALVWATPGPVHAALPHASRSTSALFPDPFTVAGTTSRIDRIASVRERELRDNRFATWGVR